ncbi:unnamed protein product [Peronospora effusa]|nr:unnamed protein product [Peronospora effusa]
MPIDVFADFVGMRPPASVVRMEEEQQRVLREGHDDDDDQPSQHNDDQQQPRPQSTSDGLFVPTSPTMLPIPQHVPPQAPPGTHVQLSLHQFYNWKSSNFHELCERPDKP